MYKLLVILTLLFLVSFGYGQEYRLFRSYDLDVDAASTVDSDEANFTDDYRGLGKFDGLVTLVLDVDSSTTASGGGNDSLYFVPMYKISGDWFTGDTIQWDRLNTASYGIDDAFIDTNIELVIVETYHDSLLIWKNDPTTTTTIEGYPMWQDFKVRVLHKDSVDCEINLDAGRH